MSDHSSTFLYTIAIIIPGNEQISQLAHVAVNLLNLYLAQRLLGQQKTLPAHKFRPSTSKFHLIIALHTWAEYERWLYQAKYSNVG